MAAPGAAGEGAERLVATVLFFVAASALLAVVGADAADGPLGPWWWAAPPQAVLGVAVVDAGRVAARGGSPDPAATAMVALAVVALGAGPLVERAGLARPAPVGAPGWGWHVAVAGVAGAAVRWRRWPTARALGALGALALGLAALRAQPPTSRTRGLHEVADAAFLLALALTLFGALTAVEEVSGRLRSARAAAASAGAQADSLAAAEARRARWEALVHDDVLSALSAAVAAGGLPRQRHAVARAAAVALEHLAADSASGPAPVAQVARRLERAAQEARPGAVVALDAGRGQLPGAVADALVDATSELVRNVGRHAGAGARTWVTGRLRAGEARVEVRDDGRGFAQDAVDGARLGLRLSVVERLGSVGGAVRVRSAPGEGTAVVLTWPS